MMNIGQCANPLGFVLVCMVDGLVSFLKILLSTTFDLFFAVDFKRQKPFLVELGICWPCKSLDIPWLDSVFDRPTSIEQNLTPFPLKKERK